MNNNIFEGLAVAIQSAVNAIRDVVVIAMVGIFIILMTILLM